MSFRDSEERDAWTVADAFYMSAFCKFAYPLSTDGSERCFYGVNCNYCSGTFLWSETADEWEFAGRGLLRCGLLFTAFSLLLLLFQQLAFLFLQLVHALLGDSPELIANLLGMQRKMEYCSDRLFLLSLPSLDLLLDEDHFVVVFHGSHCCSIHGIAVLILHLLLLLP